MEETKSSNGQKGLSRASLKRKKNKEKSSKTEIHVDDVAVVAEPSVPDTAEPSIPGEVKCFPNLSSVFKDDGDGLELSNAVVSHLLSPMSLDDFFADYSETQPLLCNRLSHEFLSGLLTKKSMEKYLNQAISVLGIDINVYKSDGFTCRRCNDISKPCTAFSNIDPEEELSRKEIRPRDLWMRAKEGCSIRWLNAQKSVDPFWKLLSAMEDVFESKTFGHVYLVPTSTLAYERQISHADAMIMQLEGHSHYKLFRPMNDEAFYPLETSYQTGAAAAAALLTATPGVIANSSSMSLEGDLLPGDTLYIPRGWGSVVDSCSGSDPSLFFRMFWNEKHQMCNLLNSMIPLAMERCVDSNMDFRLNLPRDMGRFLGVAWSEVDDEESGQAASHLEKKTKRKAFRMKMRKMMNQIAESTVDMLDVATDQQSKQFILDRLPISLAPSEEAAIRRGSSHAGERIKIYSFTKLRVVRRGVARVVVEEENVVVYHCLDNTRDFHGVDEECVDWSQVSLPEPLEFELDDGPAIEQLLESTWETGEDEGIMVSDLIHGSEEIDDKLAIAEALYKENLLIILDDATIHMGGGGEALHKKKKSKKSTYDATVTANDDDCPF